MRFDNFLNALDHGQCEDQMQRQAMFDLVLMLMLVDEEIAPEEQAFMQNWQDTLEWTAGPDKPDYYQLCMSKCRHALDNQMVDDFISHRASLLVDPELRQQALELAHEVTHSDGRLDDREREALDLLTAKLEDKR